MKEKVGGLVELCLSIPGYGGNCQLDAFLSDYVRQLKKAGTPLNPREALRGGRTNANLSSPSEASFAV